MAAIVDLDGVCTDDDVAQMVTTTKTLIENLHHHTNPNQRSTIVGEIGLDYACANSTEARRGQCALLKELLVLHRQLGKI